jgi:hypothetical protein
MTKEAHSLDLKMGGREKPVQKHKQEEDKDHSTKANRKTTKKMQQTIHRPQKEWN